MMNYSFGAGFTSEQTGIILNDQMSDFSNPNTTGYYGAFPSHVNFIKPGKRPLTSMAPTVVANTETGAVRMVIGAAGGTKIPTSISNVSIDYMAANSESIIILSVLMSDRFDSVQDKVGLE